MHDRFTPPLGSAGDNQQRATVSVRAHRRRELHEYINRIIPGGGRSERQQRLEKIGTVRQARTLLIHDLHLLTGEDGNVGKLAKAIYAPVLDHQQSGFHILEHKPKTWNHARRSPKVEIVPSALSFMPNAEMNSGTFNCSSEFCQNASSERQMMLEHQRL